MTKKSYQEVVRGIRTSKEPTMFISEVLTEIRQEIKGTDRNDKVVSLLKLLYLNLLGYSFEWAEFHVIEVMSQPNYRDRRVGYLAATVLIRPDSELFILCANSLKKAFLSKNKYDVGLALDCFSMIVTEELAHDLFPDILNLLKSKRAFVRRKAVLCLYRIYKQYPGALDESYEQLVSLLVDSDVTVQNSAVSVITELAREDPIRYQNLAPTIFNLLLSVENKWILIKLIKLLMNLVPEEPRLAKKLLDPLVNIVRTTETKSLLYEAMTGVTQCLIYMPIKAGSKLAKEVNKVSDLLLGKFMEFVEDDDPNLKYLGLCGLLKLVEVTPLTVAKKSYVYVGCMKANDSTIRMKALELILSIANTKNLKNLVEDLVTCLHSGVNFEMKEDIIAGIIDMCSRDTYANTQDFTWYVSVLVDLACTKGSHQGELISNQLIDVALRVPAIRLFTVNSVLPLLLQTDLVCESMQPVLIGAAWVVGEYSGYLQQDQIANVFASLVSPSVIYLPTSIQATILQALLQVSLRFICALGSATEQATVIKKSVIQHTEQFLSSESDEVRYRASLLIEILSVTSVFDNEVVEIKNQENIQKEIESVNSARKGMTSMNEKTEASTPDVSDVEINISSTLEAEENETPKEETPKEESPKDETPREEIVEEEKKDGINQLSQLLERLTEELLPVSAKAQKKVKIPEGLDLDTPITTFSLDKEIEPSSSVSFNDGPLFTYVSKEESGHRHRHGKKSHRHREEKEKFYLTKEEDEDEGEVRELSFEEVGVKVVEGKQEEQEQEEEAPASKFTVIRNDDDDSSEEEKKEKRKHRSHRSHRSEKAPEQEAPKEPVEEAPKEEKGERKHRRHHHHYDCLLKRYVII